MQNVGFLAMIHTVESCNFKVLGTRDFISKYRKFNYREVDIRIYNLQKMIISFFLLNICFVCAKENVSGRHSFYIHKESVFKENI